MKINKFIEEAQVHDLVIFLSMIANLIGLLQRIREPHELTRKIAAP